MKSFFEQEVSASVVEFMDQHQDWEAVQAMRKFACSRGDDTIGVIHAWPGWSATGGSGRNTESAEEA